MPRLLPCVALLSLTSLAASCAASRTPPPAIVVATPTSAARPAPQDDDFPVPKRSEPRWEVEQPLMHGFLGVTLFERVEVDDSGDGRIDGDEGELDQLPLIGGGAQWKLGGERVAYGLEGLLSFGWRGDAEAFVIGGGGAAVAIDVDLLLFELFGGPFVSTFVGDRFRLYGGAGPLLQFADYAQSGDGLVESEDGSGFGVGWYARTGVELMLQSRTLIGVGARWSDSTVDLDSGIGDLELEGLQAVLTVSRGI